MSSGDPPQINQRLPHRMPVDSGQRHRPTPDIHLPMREVFEKRPDLLNRYDKNPRVLHEVIRDLKAMVVMKPDRGFDLAARRDHALRHEAMKEGGGLGRKERGSVRQDDWMVMRNGKMVPADPETLQKLEKFAALEKMATALKPGDLKNLTGKPGTNLSPQLKEALSLFEKVFLARFEGGASLEAGTKLQKGQAKFLQKSEKTWGEFFQKFIPFTLAKKVPLSEVKELVFRGLLTKGQKDSPGTVKGEMVSDLKLASGKTDKFARLEVQGHQVLEELASKMPGDVLATALIAEWVGGPELAYQALSHKVVNPEMAKDMSSAAVEAYQSPEEAREAAIKEGVRDVKQGIALDARTEQRMAEHLDIDLKQNRLDPRSESIGRDERGGVIQAKKSDSFFGGLFKKKKKGLLAGMMTWEESQDDYVFVPWYEHIFKRKKFTGKVRWYMPLIYFVGFSATGLFLVYVFKFLLQR